MMYIPNPIPPEAYIHWEKTEPKESQTFESNTFPKNQVKKALLDNQHYLCAYTLLRIDEERCHIEHFHPQSARPDEATDLRNMFACFPKDRNIDPVTFGAVAKDNSVETIYNPHTKNLEKHFRYTKGGEIIGNDEMADRTIKVLNLNDKILVARRKAAIDSIFKQCHSAASAKQFADEIMRPSRYNRLSEFCIMQRDLLLSLATKLENKATRLINEHKRKS